MALSPEVYLIFLRATVSGISYTLRRAEKLSDSLKSQ